MPFVNVSLSPELMQVVQAKVDNGEYSDTSALVSDAIRQLNARDRLLYDIKVDHLKQALAPGLHEAATGQFAGYDLESLMVELDAEPES